jgi:hypothetical protein
MVAEPKGNERANECARGQTEQVVRGVGLHDSGQGNADE